MKESKSKLIGRTVYITDKGSLFYGEWAVVAHYDGEYYHVMIANGHEINVIFERNQFKVPRKNAGKTNTMPH